MEIFFQACGAVLLSVILILSMGSHGKDFGLLVTMGVCVIVMTAAMAYFRPVLDFIDTLVSFGGLNRELVQILLKSAGICIVGETASLICADAGSSSMGKVIHILATAAILWLSVPLFSLLVDLLQRMMGEL